MSDQPNQPAPMEIPAQRGTTTGMGDERREALRLLRLGGGAAILGQVLLLGASAFHPSQEHPADHPAVFREYAGSGSWITVHLVQWLGGILMFVALATLAHHVIRQGRKGRVPARIALAATVTVAALFTVLQAVDGVSLKMAVDAWAGATPENSAAAFSAAEAIRWTEIGLNAFARIVQGVAVAAVAVAAAAAGVHGRLLGALGLLAGIGGAAGALATAYTGFSTLAATVGMGPWVLGTVWLFSTGVVMWRRGGVSTRTAPTRGSRHFALRRSGKGVRAE